MPSGQADYQIAIKTDADLAGAKATLAALEAGTAAAERMGIAVGDAHKEIARQIRAKLESKKLLKYCTIGLFHRDRKSVV